MKHTCPLCNSETRVVLDLLRGTLQTCACGYTVTYDELFAALTIRAERLQGALRWLLHKFTTERSPYYFKCKACGATVKGRTMLVHEAKCMSTDIVQCCSYCLAEAAVGEILQHTEACHMKILAELAGLDDVPHLLFKINTPELFTVLSSHKG